MEVSDIEKALGSAQRDLKECAALLKASRAGKLVHLTRRMNIVNTLLADGDYLEEVKGNMLKFSEQLNEFKALQESYVQMLSEEERVEDLNTWYGPKMRHVDEFVGTVERWLSAFHVPAQANNNDNASVVSSVRSNRSSRSGRSSVSSTSARISAEAKRVALLAKANKLQQKHDIEKKEELKRMKEVWEVQTEIAATTAKIEYLKNAESPELIDNIIMKDSMNEYCEEMLNKISPSVANTCHVKRKETGRARLPIEQEQLKGANGKLWYIPHHSVYHPQKHTVRVVFDCGAVFQGKSLNSELLQGPDLTSTLFNVLTRFRQEPVAVMTDIKAMFHQVRVSASDVDGRMVILISLWGNIEC